MLFLSGPHCRIANAACQLCAGLTGVAAILAWVAFGINLAVAFKVKNAVDDTDSPAESVDVGAAAYLPLGAAVSDRLTAQTDVTLTVVDRDDGWPSALDIADTSCAIQAKTRLSWQRCRVSVHTGGLQGSRPEDGNVVTHSMSLAEQVEGSGRRRQDVHNDKLTRCE